MDGRHYSGGGDTALVDAVRKEVEWDDSLSVRIHRDKIRP